MTIEITPQAVKDAYDKYPHIRPIRGCFTKTNIDNTAIKCACAISILAIDAVGEKEVLTRGCKHASENVWDIFKEIAGKSDNWMWAFVSGFDAAEYPTPYEKEAFEIGASARKLVFS